LAVCEGPDVATEFAVSGTESAISRFVEGTRGIVLEKVDDNVFTDGAVEVSGGKATDGFGRRRWRRWRLASSRIGQGFADLRTAQIGSAAGEGV